VAGTGTTRRALPDRYVTPTSRRCPGRRSTRFTGRDQAIRSTLNRTPQTDIVKEYIARKEWLFPPQPHPRLIGGATAAQELAYTLADGFAYVELGRSRGLAIDAHIDFFEEIATFRAARRIWARVAVPDENHPIGQLTSGIPRCIDDGRFTGDDLEIMRVGHEVEREQQVPLRDRLAARRADEVDRTIAAVRAEAALGEIRGALGTVWGGYIEPATF
jgi:methylmalonyl-CoA mutase N-terminal domain/subunit